MRKSEKIENFIKECFAALSINYKEFFYYCYEEDKPEDISWADEHGKICIEPVKHASKVLGISVEDLLSCNSEALAKWERKYRYFWDVKPFEVSYEKTFCSNEFDKVRMLEAILDIKTPELYTDRYNYDAVIRRLIDQLKEFDKSLPGTYHQGEKLTNIQITTSNFCHFEDIKPMTECYLEMADRVIELFIKAVKNYLSSEEEQEYNMLVSVFGLRDKWYTKGYLYYESLKDVKDLFADVTKENFFDTLIFRKVLNFKPWLCAEFIDDRRLVERYLRVFPGAKSEMRRHSVDTGHFTCVFVWSDAKPIMYSPEDETEILEVCQVLGEEPIPYEKRAKEHTTVYVKKTAEELGDDDKVAEKLASYCRPEKLGGIPTALQTHSDYDFISRTMAMISRIPSNSFIQNIIDKANSSDGGNE